MRHSSSCEPGDPTCDPRANSLGDQLMFITLLYRDEYMCQLQFGQPTQITAQACLYPAFHVRIHLAASSHTCTDINLCAVAPLKFITEERKSAVYTKFNIDKPHVTHSSKANITLRCGSVFHTPMEASPNDTVTFMKVGAEK